MWETVIFANFAHGVIAVAYTSATRRLLSPLSASSAALLWALCVVAPPVVIGVQLLTGSLGAFRFRVLRVDEWVRLAYEIAPPLPLLAMVLFAGTATLFILQELGPSVTQGRRQRGAPQVSDNRLDASLERVRKAFGSAKGVELTPRLRIACVNSGLATAMLTGIRRPRVLIDRALLDRYDDDELDAVVAHELAHLVRGGRLPLIVLWGLRALQAANPGPLIAFRRLVETEELASDALVVEVLAKPGALASALLKAGRRHARAPHDQDGVGAFEELVRRGDLGFKKVRVKALLHPPAGRSDRHPTIVLAAILLLGILWLVG